MQVPLPPRATPPTYKVLLPTLEWPPPPYLHGGYIWEPLGYTGICTGGPDDTFSFCDAAAALIEADCEFCYFRGSLVLGCPLDM